MSGVGILAPLTSDVGVSGHGLTRWPVSMAMWYSHGERSLEGTETSLAHLGAVMSAANHKS